jgi:ASCH domain
MKALSVKQPWANMIASGGKTIETRTWATDYRGDVLIVSSKMPKIEPAGCALAVARIVDCRPMTSADVTAACCDTYPNAFAWVLADIRRIKPFPLRGHLGIYDVEVSDSSLEWLSSDGSRTS